MPAPNTYSSDDADDDVAGVEERDSRHLDFGHINEDQDPDTIAREVEAVYERHGM
jgi:hypothetical protein